MGIPASPLIYFNVMTAIPSDQRNSGGLAIDMEIRPEQQ
jgi:hypothetical protein